MKAINTLHFYYAAIVGITIGFSGLATGINPSSVLTTLLFLPITLYFIFELIKGYYLWRYQTYINYKRALKEGNFLITFFLTQEDPLFMISLGLLSLVVSFSILRFILFDPSLNLAPIDIVLKYLNI